MHKNIHALRYQGDGAIVTPSGMRVLQLPKNFHGCLETAAPKAPFGILSAGNAFLFR